MRRILPLVIAFLALGAMGDSLYLTLDHFKVLGQIPAGQEDFCAALAGSCQSVVQSPQSTVLGVPIALLGAGSFAMVFAAALLRLRTGEWPMAGLFEVVLSIGLFFSGYLVYSLLFEIKIVCPYCLGAHAANAAMVLLYALSSRLDRPHAVTRGRWALGTR